MIDRCWREKRIPSGRIGSTSDTLPNWIDARNSHIPQDRNDIRNIVYIKELGEIAMGGKIL